MTETIGCYRFDKQVIIAHNNGLFFNQGLSWSAISSKVLSRSIALRYEKSADDLSTVFTPVVRGRVGPLLDWLHAREETELVQLTNRGSWSVGIANTIPASFGKAYVTDILGLFDHPPKDIALIVILLEHHLFVFHPSVNWQRLKRRLLGNTLLIGAYNQLRLLRESHGLPSLRDLRVSPEIISILKSLSPKPTISKNTAIRYDFALREWSDVKLDMDFSQLSSMVDPIFGPIRCLARSPGAFSNQRSWSAVPAKIDYMRAKDSAPLQQGIGSMHHSDDIAKTVTLAEAWERYALTGPDEKGCELLPLSALKQSIGNIERLGLYSKASYMRSGFPYQDISSLHSVHCTSMQDWKTEEEILMPVDLVWLSNIDKIVQSTSSGVATHRTKEEAALNALLELIERHLFLITWHRYLPLSRIRTSSLPQMLRELVADLPESYELSLLYCFSQSFPSLHTCFASIRSKDFLEAPSCITGGATSFSLIRAAEKAICECMRGYLHFQDEWASKKNELLSPNVNLTNLTEQVMWHWVPGRQKYSAHLFDLPEQNFPARTSESLMSARERFSQLADRVVSSGSSLWIKDITPTDFLNAPKVIRIICSGLAPLYFGPALLRNARVYQMLGGSKWNTAPHPYP